VTDETRTGTTGPSEASARCGDRHNCAPVQPPGRRSSSRGLRCPDHGRGPQRPAAHRATPWLARDALRGGGFVLVYEVSGPRTWTRAGASNREL
jgi:hypothetical protein